MSLAAREPKPPRAVAPTARTIGSYEAKTHLPRLLDEVERGATFVITKHGRPVARLVGVRHASTSGLDLGDEFAQLRAKIPLDPGFSIRDALNEGRR